MNNKFSDFLCSYGLMGAGLLLMFIATISFRTGYYPLLKFPEAGSLSVQAQAGGDAVINPILPLSKPIIPLAKDKIEFKQDLSAAAVYIVDDETGTVLYDKNSEAVRPLASITKLVSAMVLVDLPVDWATTTMVQVEDCDGSSHHINPGEKFSLNDLWNIALIGSSNSAILTMVRASGITQDNFVLLMNRKAQQLGLTTAKFVEPTGLDAGNTASARDVANLLKSALNVKKISDTMHVGEYYAQPLNKDKKRRIWTTNWLLTNWVPNDFKEENICGKTGYIVDSGYNFTVRLTDDRGHSVRVVILGAKSEEARFIEARDLGDWVFDHYLWPDDPGYEMLVE